MKKTKSTFPARNALTSRLWWIADAIRQGPLLPPISIYANIRTVKLVIQWMSGLHEYRKRKAKSGAWIVTGIFETKLQYNPAFDGIRALAVAAVVLQHADMPFISGGFVGVDVFFVLSGYLITSILLRELEGTGRIRIGRFLFNRAVRLMPPLFLLFAALLVVGPYFWPHEPIVLLCAIVALYLADYVSALIKDVSMLGHTWSLAVEEHFYLIWPMLLIMIATLRRSPSMKLFMCLFVVATLWRIANAWYFPDWGMSAYRFDTRASGLILGSAMAFGTVQVKEKYADSLGFASLAILLCLTFMLSERPLVVAFVQPIIDLAAAGLVISLSGTRGSAFFRFFSSKPLVYGGLISYSVYLWHYPISRAVLQFVSDWPTVLSITLVLSVVIASLSYEFLELPLRNWRHRRLVVAQ